MQHYARHKDKASNQEQTKNKMKVYETQKHYREVNKCRIAHDKKLYHSENKKQRELYIKLYRQLNKERISISCNKVHQKIKNDILEDLHSNSGVKTAIELQLGIRSLSDWYKVSRGQLRNLPEKRIFKYLSVIQFLKAVYPNVNWEPELFMKAKFKIFNWEERHHVRNFLLSAEKLLGIRETQDWYFVSKKQNFRGWGVLFPSAIKRQLKGSSGINAEYGEPHDELCEELLFETKTVIEFKNATLCETQRQSVKPGTNKKQDEGL
eukprot:TRINITY_DN7493_c0_g1_i1.p1 TRINITY_DN7493_c0_g1~~TRINITY_DN7493_c0_g1_i1.p1  ORF type:complete len:265 (+),score=46.98 TRINITY_DN7493_c0_g1_i1:139-933(+)